MNFVLCSELVGDRFRDECSLCSELIGDRFRDEFCLCSEPHVCFGFRRQFISGKVVLILVRSKLFLSCSSHGC